MKTLSANTATKLDKPFVDIVRLAVIELDGLTLRLSDRIFGLDGSICQFDSEFYEPFILAWDQIDMGRINHPEYNLDPSEASLTINNASPIGGADSLISLFQTYAPHFCQVTIFEIYNGATAAADKVDLFVGTIEDIIDISPTRLTISLTGRELDISNKFNHKIITFEEFDKADRRDLGRMLPQVYGSAKAVPFLGIKTGASSYLYNDIDYDDTTIELTDATFFPSSGTIEIDSEVITYTGKSGNSLTGCSRGTGTEEAAGHTAGAIVEEQLTEKIYAIGHVCKAINDVYVGDKRISSDMINATMTKYPTGHSSYPNYACIGFTYPEGSGGLAGIVAKMACLKNSTLVKFKPTGFGYGGGSGNIADLNDSNMQTCYDSTTDGYDIFTTFEGGANQRCFTVFFTQITSHMKNTVKTVKLHILADTSFASSPDSSVLVRAGSRGQIDDYTPNSFDPSSPATPGCPEWFEFTLSNSLYAEYVAILWNDVAGSDIRVYDIHFEFDFTPDDSPDSSCYPKCTFCGEDESPTSKLVGPTFGSDPIKVEIDRIYADVDGFEDGGTLIERPDLIMDHIITDRCGQASAVLDSTSYAALATKYTNNGYVLGFAILKKPDVKDLLAEVARQAKTMQWWEAGVHKLKFLDPPPATADKTICGYMVDKNTITLKYTNRADIENKMTARYDRLWSGKTDVVMNEKNVVNASSSESILKYTEIQKDDRAFEFITDEDQALDVLNRELDVRADVFLMAKFKGGYWLADLERGDYINLATDTDDDLSLAVMGIINSGDIFMVLNAARLENSILIEAVRLVDFAEVFVDTDDVAFVDGDDVIFR